jgi:hypothetical protein
MMVFVVSALSPEPAVEPEAAVDGEPAADEALDVSAAPVVEEAVEDAEESPSDVTLPELSAAVAADGADAGAEPDVALEAPDTTAPVAELAIRTEASEIAAAGGLTVSTAA